MHQARCLSIFLLAEAAAPTSRASDRVVEISGVVVDEVAPASEIEKAGLRVGDVLNRWERPSSPPANPERAQGNLTSPFDWMWLEVEQAHRGPVVLYGSREGRPKTWHVAVGEWNVHFNWERRGRSRVRPNLAAAEAALYEQGHNQIRRGKVAVGVATWRELAKLVAERKDGQPLPWLLLRIGEVLGDANDWPRAQGAFREAALAALDDRARVFLWEALGKSFDYQGRSREAADCYRSGLVLRKATEPDSLGVARSLHQIASDELFLMNLARAKEGFDQVLALRTRLAPGSFLEADSLHSQALVARDLDEAQSYMKRSIAIQERIGPTSFWMADKLGALADIYGARSDTELAAYYAQRALEIRQRLVPGGESVGHALIQVGRAKLELGLWSEAKGKLEQALSILRRPFVRDLMVAAIFNDLGAVALGEGDLRQAEEYYRRALVEFEEIDREHPWSANTWRSLADIEARRGRWNEALVDLQRALVRYRRVGSGDDGEALTLAGLGRIAWRAGDLEQASSQLRDAVRVLETQVGRLGGSEDVKAKFRSVRRSVYFDAAAVELDLGRNEVAFGIQEAARAQGFLSLLAARDLSVADGIPAELEEERRRVGNQFRKALAAVNSSSGLGAQAAASAWRELPVLRDQLDSISLRIRKLSPGLSALHFPRPLLANELAQELDPGMKLLAYQVGDSATHAFVLSKDGHVSAFTLPIGENSIRREVERFRAAAEGGLIGREERGISSLSHLYRSLVKPLEPALDGASRLLILPDGPLHALPWGALVRELEAPNPGTGRSWHFLVETRPFTVALSATVWAELKHTRERVSTTAWPAVERGSESLPIAAFGDPVVRSAPPNEEPSGVAGARLAGAHRRGLKLSPLPFSRREVENIAQLFSGQVATYVGTEATEERAKGLPKLTRIVHFATHGWADERLPMSSGLLLTAPTTTDEHSEDGFLQAWEIFESVRLDADLVVLSACDSGRGRELGGEGLLSLSRAFQFAGARSVVASLWEVPDEGSGLLMERFYRHLKAGSTASDALREAQLEMIAQIPWDGVLQGERSARDLSRDFAWAAFEVFGDYR